MAIREHERRQRQREQSPSQAGQRARSVVPRTAGARDYVLTFAEWCELNSFSEPTGKRIIARGEGPPVLQLSLRRLGIRMSDNLAWQESRVRASA